MPTSRPPAISPHMRTLVEDLEDATRSASRVHGWDVAEDRRRDAREALHAGIAALEARCARLQAHARSTIDDDRMEWQSDRDVLTANRLRTGDLGDAPPRTTVRSDIAGADRSAPEGNQSGGTDE